MHENHAFQPDLPGNPCLPGGVLAIATVGNVGDMLIHNVRNLLSVISMQAQLIQGKGEALPPAQRRLAEIVSQVEAIDGQLGALLRLSGLQPRYRLGWHGFRMELEEIIHSIYGGLEVTLVWPDGEPEPFPDGLRALLHHLVLQVLHFLVHHDPGKHPLRLTLGFPQTTDTGADTRRLWLCWELDSPLPPEVLEPDRGLAENGRGKTALALALPGLLIRALGGELHRELRTDGVRLHTTLDLDGWERQRPDDQRQPAPGPSGIQQPGPGQP